MKLDETVISILKLTAYTDKHGEWWGHDAPLGNTAELTAQIRQLLLECEEVVVPKRTAQEVLSGRSSLAYISELFQRVERLEAKVVLAICTPI